MSYPELVSEVCTPKVIWYQTDFAVVARIMLPDVKKYFLHVENDHLLFSTTVNNKDYYLCLYLFGTVVAEDTRHANLGREIKVSLTKAHRYIDWLRLQIGRQKNPLIVPDTDYLCEAEWTDVQCVPYKCKTVEEYKKRNNVKYIMPDVPSSDEEESDDEKRNVLFEEYS